MNSFNIEIQILEKLVQVVILRANSFKCECNSTEDYSRGYQTDQIRMANDLLNPQKSKIEIEFHWANSIISPYSIESTIC